MVQTAKSTLPACNPGKGIRMGDVVAVSLSGAKIRWDTTGAFVKLKTEAGGGSGKEVELVVSTGGSGISPPFGDCLRSGSYFRMASTKHAEPTRYLQADPRKDPDHLVIGNYPDPNPDSNFYLLKVGGKIGDIIERGDEVIIRGTPLDRWLVAPTNSVNGTPVALSPDQQAASIWVFGNKNEG